MNAMKKSTMSFIRQVNLNS